MRGLSAVSRSRLGVYGDQSRRLIDRELDESGVTQFGQTGMIDDLYREAGIDADAIVAAAQALAPGRPIRYAVAS